MKDEKWFKEQEMPKQKSCIEKIKNSECGECVVFDNCVYRIFFAAGRLASLREAREAVIKLDNAEMYQSVVDGCGSCGNIEGLCDMSTCSEFIVLMIHAVDAEKILAAIDRLMER